MIITLPACRPLLPCQHRLHAVGNALVLDARETRTDPAPREVVLTANFARHGAVSYRLAGLKFTGVTAPVGLPTSRPGRWLWAAGKRPSTQSRLRATRAPWDGLDQLARRIGFRHFCATWPDLAYPDRKRSRQARRVLRELAAGGFAALSGAVAAPEWAVAVR